MVTWENTLQYQLAKVEFKFISNFTQDPNYINKCVYEKARAGVGETPRMSG